MNKFLKYKSYFLVGLSFILIILFCTDSISIWTNPTDYLNVYNFSEDSLDWRFKSVCNYLISNTIYIAFLISYICLNILFIRNKLKIYKSLLLIVEIILLTYLFYNFYMSYINGFDH